MRPASAVAGVFFTGVVAAAALGACGGDTVAPPPNPYPGVTEYLNLDLTRLKNYASPAWPLQYDAAVFAQLDNSGANPVTNAGATLGRVLFFDKRLSINNQRSCASCHGQALGFSDSARFSLGFDGVGRTGAHSMRLGNARFYAETAFFWNRRAPSIEFQATQPIRNAVEMGFSAGNGGIDSLIKKMNGLPYYPELFKFVYGDSAITETRIQRAIAQYVRSIAAIGSRWDDGYEQVYNPVLADKGLSLDVPGLSPIENRGRTVFLTPADAGGGGCATCHIPPTFALDKNSKSNGLDSGETVLFKSPSLKNVAVTGPYMHDGRFNTLDEVVGFYDTGVKDGPALDARLKAPGGQPRQLNLLLADRVALVAFMKTLTDTRLANDQKFTDPFIK
jgi:cytochrome c peroxidase